MKHFIKIILLNAVLLIVLFYFSCATGQNRFPLPETILNSDKSRNLRGTELAELKEGRRILIRDCGSCHRAYSPLEYTLDEWEKKILPDMTKRAGLSKEEVKKVKKYISAAITSQKSTEK